jgi:RHS repeat-associated protein
VETAYTYDGDGNVRTLETKAGEDVLLSFAYRYDGNGNRTAKAGVTLGGITSEITAGNNALDISYAYDVRGQLLEERRNGASVCYAYDKAGNRIRKTDAQGEIRYLYNEKNQLVEEESPADRKQFSYDRQGGIIEEKNAAGIRRFSYNSRHQQTRVETETGSVQENRYDAEGLRFELLENGRRTSFVYHDGELLQEEGREEQGTSYHLGAGMEAFRRGQELSYYHRDEQLSTVFVTDGQGEIRNSYQYDAFGIPLETTEQLNNRIRYTGQQYDELTEQYYLRARYYNPVAGRFMQEDVYQGDGLNLYAYCGNNPVVYDDPSGYASTSTGKACPPKGKISESVDESGTSSVAKPNHGQGFSSKGYNPKPGERTRDQRQRGTEPYHRQEPGDRQRY